MSDFSGKHSFLGVKRGGVRTFLIGFFSIEGVGCNDVTYLNTYLDIRESYKAW